MLVKTRRIGTCSLRKILFEMSTRFLIPSDALEIDNVLLGSFVASIVQEGGLGGLVVCFENGGREARLGVRMSIWMAEGI